MAGHHVKGEPGSGRTGVSNPRTKLPFPVVECDTPVLPKAPHTWIELVSPMSVRWDPLLTAATAEELHSRLAGARVRGLTLDRDGRRVIVHMRDQTLVLELHPLRGWLSLLPPNEALEAARPYAGTVRRVHAPPDESILVLVLRPVRGAEPLELVIEMIGNRWNAIVVASKSGAIRHVLYPRRDRKRVLEVGTLYEPPTPTKRLGLDQPLDQEQWSRLAASAHESEEASRSEILRGIAWTSSINVGALLGPDGWEAWNRMIAPEGWGAFLVDMPSGPQPYPCPVPPQPSRPLPTLLEAFRVGRESEPDAEPRASLLVPPALVRDLERRRKDARRKVRALRRERDGLEEPGSIRGIGDLILARFAQIPRGAESVILRDFEGQAVEVQMDPSSSVQENADRYYRQAARLERAWERVPRLLGEAEEDEARCSALLEKVRRGEVEPDSLARIPRAQRPREGSSGTGGESPLPYRRFLSSGGLEIRVGKGARQNDDLTFHHSSPRDVWLHVRQAPGAHVILRWAGEGPPPRNDLAEAATLAAVHSSARHSGSVPVAWTRRKYVRKPRGASPGTVIPERVQTVFVAPDPGIVDRLAPAD